MSRTVVVVPRLGLGDVLYHLLFINYVQERLGFSTAVIFSPPYGRFLCDLFDVSYFPLSTLLTSLTGGISISREFAFWKTVRQLRGAHMACFTHDMFDGAMIRLSGCLPFAKTPLGNLMCHENLGMRYKLNQMFNALGSNGHPNPKHVVARQLAVLNQYEEVSKDELLDYYERTFLLKTKGINRSVPSCWREQVVIFPETARAIKNFTSQQLSFLMQALSDQYDITLVAKTKPTGLKDLPYTYISTADPYLPLTLTMRASYVIAADTFGAHLAGAMGVTTYVIYNDPARNLHGERWGIARDCACHVERGRFYSLDATFSAVFRESENLLEDALQQVSLMDNTTHSRRFSGTRSVS